MKTITTETTVETLNDLRIVHVTDNRKRPTDAYELRNGTNVVAWAHANGTMFAVNLGDPDAPLADRKFVGLATSRGAALNALRTAARAL